MCFLEYWSWVKDFSNSNFFTAIAGSLAGAFAGAYGAQRIAERSKLREEMTKEIRICNTAISLSGSMCASILAMKEQSVKPLKDEYDSQVAGRNEHKNGLISGRIVAGTPFAFTANLQTLSLPVLPAAILQTQVFQHLSIVGRPLNLATQISQSLDGLKDSVNRRNQLIEQYKHSGGCTPQQYFGFKLDGVTNSDYPNTVEAIARQVDDVIFFCSLLCEDLTAHGDQISKKYSQKFRDPAPRVSQYDFTKCADLMPDRSQYTDWLTNFSRRREDLAIAKA